MKPETIGEAANTRTVTLCSAIDRFPFAKDRFGL